MTKISTVFGAAFAIGCLGTRAICSVDQPGMIAFYVLVVILGIICTVVLGVTEG